MNVTQLQENTGKHEVTRIRRCCKWKQAIWHNFSHYGYFLKSVGFLLRGDRGNPVLKSLSTQTQTLHLDISDSKTKTRHDASLELWFRQGRGLKLLHSLNENGLQLSLAPYFASYWYFFGLLHNYFPQESKINFFSVLYGLVLLVGPDFEIFLPDTKSLWLLEMHYSYG